MTREQDRPMTTEDLARAGERESQRPGTTASSGRRSRQILLDPRNWSSSPVPSWYRRHATVTVGPPDSALSSGQLFFSRGIARRTISGRATDPAHRDLEPARTRLPRKSARRIRTARARHAKDDSRRGRIPSAR
jgi:hypothetical protein